MKQRGPLITFVAGSLGQGGAEKQLFMILRALKHTGVKAEVLSLTKGEYFENILSENGWTPRWVGSRQAPLLRTFAIAKRLRATKPLFVQSCHFFTNPYAGVAGRMAGAFTIGAVRCDLQHAFRQNRPLAPFLLRSAHHIVANSHTAWERVCARGLPAQRVSVLTNVLDLDDFDAAAAADVQPLTNRRFSVLAVGSLIHVKRFDLFIRAVALARKKNSDLCGILVGDGPQQASLQQLAVQNNLSPDAFVFLGRRNNVPAVLRHSSALVITSEHEGVPNVLLEAMAAGIPVISTPAGDCTRIIGEAHSGFIVNCAEPHSIAERILQLAASPELCSCLGRAGRRFVEQAYSFRALPGRLRNLYLRLPGGDALFAQPGVTLERT